MVSFILGCVFALFCDARSRSTEDFQPQLSRLPPVYERKQLCFSQNRFGGVPKGPLLSLYDACGRFALLPSPVLGLFSSLSCFVSPLAPSVFCLISYRGVRAEGGGQDIFDFSHLRPRNMHYKLASDTLKLYYNSIITLI